MSHSSLSRGVVHYVKEAHANDSRAHSIIDCSKRRTTVANTFITRETCSYLYSISIFLLCLLNINELHDLLFGSDSCR